MSKMLPMAAALFFFYAAVALLRAAGSQAAVVEHTFVVSRNACMPSDRATEICFSFSRLIFRNENKEQLFSTLFCISLHRFSYYFSLLYIMPCGEIRVICI
jgi:hypothetical protein